MAAETTAPAPFKRFADPHCEVGEGPLWNDADGMLYWIDVSRGEAFRKTPGTPADLFERHRLNLGKIGGMVFTRDNACLLFAAQGRVWHWRAGAEPRLHAGLAAAADSRFNDVIADPAGRVFCGVAPAAQGGTGSLWRLDPGGAFACIEPATAGMPNGMGFSPDRAHFYFTVTNERVIHRYDYHQETGELSNRTPLVRVPTDEGFPDGLTVDAEGCLWSAQWEGGRLVRYAPDGGKIAEYRFPIRKITAAAFGGPDLDVLFVTTANHPWDAEDDALRHAGAVYALKQSVRGMAEFRVGPP